MAGAIPLSLVAETSGLGADRGCVEIAAIGSLRLDGAWPLKWALDEGRSVARSPHAYVGEEDVRGSRDGFWLCYREGGREPVR